jgi:hypothetical protein
MNGIEVLTAGMGQAERCCACGCGEKMTADARGRMRFWVRGHHALGKKHSAAWSKNQSEGMKRAWSDGEKFEALRVQPRELVERRVAPLRGRKVAAEVREKISQGLKGRELSEEHRLKCAKNWLKGFDGLSPEAKAKFRKAISQARLGCHNYGRAARDRLDHFQAKHWMVRDPAGIIFEFDNLQAWCRANEWRFQPDDYPQSKRPLWHRAALGFGSQMRTDKKGCHHWKGWTLVSVEERKELGAPDLLNRKLPQDAEQP